ncbi:MAG: hypothetical protein BalsKO_19600 [Balneolaceae bacterium]
MSVSRIGEFEEIILLLVGILDNEAYAFNVAEEFESQINQSTSIGAVHATLNRLAEKGFLISEMSKPVAERGGRRKRIYSITAAGKRALEHSRKLKTSLWKQYPAFNFDGFSLSFEE